MSVDEVDTPQASSQVRGDIIKHTRGYLPKLTCAHKQGYLNTRLIFITQQAIRYSLLLRLHPTYMFLESPSTLSVQFLDRRTDSFTKPRILGNHLADQFPSRDMSLFLFALCLFGRLIDSQFVSWTQKFSRSQSTFTHRLHRTPSDPHDTE
jgi:hypothetical protein